MRQKNQIELNLGTGAEGEARSAAAQEPEACTAKTCLERPAVAGPSMEAVVERENLKTALAQVKRNKGAVPWRPPRHPPFPPSSDWTAEKYRRFDQGERMPGEWKPPQQPARV